MLPFQCMLPTCVCKLHQSRLTPCGEFVHDGLVSRGDAGSLPSRAPLAELVVCDYTKEPLHASQACAQCYAQYDNRRAIIITALDAEAILRAGALLLRCSPPTRLSKVPAMPVFANLAHIPLGCSASRSHRLTLHACEDFMPDMA